MSYTIKLLPIVQQDLKKAKEWYNSQQDLLGEKFKVAIHQALAYLSQYPAHFQLKYKGLRRAPVSRFPFAIYYFLEESNKRLIIVGVIHTSRNPDIIKLRVK